MQTEIVVNDGSRERKAEKADDVEKRKNRNPSHNIQPKQSFHEASMQGLDSEITNLGLVDLGRDLKPKQLQIFSSQNKTWRSILLNFISLQS
jgi:hypothetical protein